MLLAVGVALPLGALAAASRRGALDHVATLYAQCGIAVPNFWIGLLLILGVSLKLGWLPAGGFPGWSAGLWPGLKSLILPAIALGLPQSAVLTRVTRAAVLDVLNEDFVRTARAKGLSRRQAALAPRRAQCAGADRHHHGASGLVPDRRSGAGRERVHAAGPRPAGLAGPGAARPRRHQGCGADPGRRGAGDQLGGRRSLRPGSIRACGAGRERAGPSRPRRRHHRGALCPGAGLARLDAGRRGPPAHRGPAEAAARLRARRHRPARPATSSRC